jgi:predicted nucleotidyltransferase
MSKKKDILNQLSNVARRLFGDGSGSVYLYGSQARNEAKSSSDWDILIITDDNVTGDDEERFTRFAFPFAEVGWHLGAQITPLLFSRSEWEAQRGSLFFLNVSSDAIRL